VAIWRRVVGILDSGRSLRHLLTYNSFVQCHRSAPSAWALVISLAS